LKRYLFKKNQRLRTNEQFRDVLGYRCRVCNELFCLYIAANTCGYPRLGVSVSRKCGNAVLRNRIKRLVREVFRLQQHNIDADYDYLLIFLQKLPKKPTSAKQPGRSDITFDRLDKSFLELAAKGAEIAKKRE